MNRSGRPVASLDAARRFLLAEARLLEQRVAAAVFDGATVAGALDALRAYRNEDGGFGHGLEPDKRVPASQPLDVETAFEVMDALGHVDRDMVVGACGYLERLGPGVGCLTPDALGFPRASHWDTWAVEPSLNPTAGIVAHLWRWGVDHPWRDEATRFCWQLLERGLPKDAHTFREVLQFLDAVGDDRERAEACAAALPRAVSGLDLFRFDPDAEGYGLTPLHFAPDPQSRWVPLFDDVALERHLDALARAQQDDGGWPISWETVGPAARQEWRGVETLRAVRALDAFGRLE